MGAYGSNQIQPYDCLIKFNEVNSGISEFEPSVHSSNT